MTKQEEIMEGVIADITKACPKMLCGDIVKLADTILRGESSQGVVIKVDLGDLTVQEYMIRDKSKDVAVEPLI